MLIGARFFIGDFLVRDRVPGVGLNVGVGVGSGVGGWVGKIVRKPEGIQRISQNCKKQQEIQMEDFYWGRGSPLPPAPKHKQPM